MTTSSRHVIPPTLIETSYGLFVEPIGTLEALFSEEYPRHTIPLLFLSTLLFCCPVVLLAFKLQFVYQIEQFLVAGASFLISFLIAFLFMEIIWLSLVRVPLSFFRTISLLSYAIWPLAIAFFLIFVFNAVTSGQFAFTNKAVMTITSMVPGFTNSALKVIPLVVAVASLSSIVVLGIAISACGDLGVVTGISLGILSIIPALLSLVLALVCADFILPGFATEFGKTFLGGDKLISLILTRLNLM